MNYERIAAKFQQRLAETVARYEADLAIQADNYESQIEALSARVEELENPAPTEAPADVDVAPEKEK